MDECCWLGRGVARVPSAFTAQAENFVAYLIGLKITTAPLAEKAKACNKPSSAIANESLRKTRPNGAAQRRTNRSELQQPDSVGCLQSHRARL